MLKCFYEKCCKFHLWNLFLFLRYLHFWPNFFDYVEKRLDNFNININLKTEAIFKITTSSTEKQIITLHILCNISRSKENQKMKFGQLIEFNVKNFFLWNLCRKWGDKTRSRPLYFRKASYELVGTSVSIFFYSSQFGKTIKKTIKF